MCPRWKLCIYSILPSVQMCYSPAAMTTAFMMTSPPWSDSHCAGLHKNSTVHVQQKEKEREKQMSLSDSIHLRRQTTHTAGDHSVDIHIFNSLCNKNNYTSLFKELYDIEKSEQKPDIQKCKAHIQYRKHCIARLGTIIPFLALFGVII